MESNESRGVDKRSKSSVGRLQVESAAPLKSNLKKTASVAEMNDKLSPAGLIRKVSWSDAHGKDIAHVQEFEPRYGFASIYIFRVVNSNIRP